VSASACSAGTLGSGRGRTRLFEAELVLGTRPFEGNLWSGVGWLPVLNLLPASTFQADGDNFH